MSAMILIVDDEESIRDMLVDSLESEGYQTCVAMNSIEGLRQLAEQKPDLVVSDIRMPGMDGYTFCRHVQKWGDIPIILMTGVPQEMRWFRQMDIGASAYLAKPFDLDEFKKQVATLLNGEKPVDDIDPAQLTSRTVIGPRDGVPTQSNRQDETSTRRANNTVHPPVGTNAGQIGAAS